MAAKLERGRPQFQSIWRFRCCHFNDVNGLSSTAEKNTSLNTRKVFSKDLTKERALVVDKSNMSDKTLTLASCIEKAEVVDSSSGIQSCIVWMINITRKILSELSQANTKLKADLDWTVYVIRDLFTDSEYDWSTILLVILQLFAKGFCLFSYDGIIIEETYLTISNLAIFLECVHERLEAVFKKEVGIMNYSLKREYLEKWMSLINRHPFSRGCDDEDMFKVWASTL